MKINEVLDEAQVDVLIDAIEQADTVYFDLETVSTSIHDAAEDWHPTSRITAAAFCLRDDEAWVMPLAHPAAPWADTWRDTATRVFSAMKGRKVSAHNAKFDIRWVHSATGVDLVDDLAWDTMISAYVLDENERKGLKHLAVTLLGVEDWSETFDARRTDTAPWPDLAHYNAMDVIYGRKVMDLHRVALAGERGLARVFGLLMMPLARALLRIERNGLLLDVEVTEDLHDEAFMTIEVIESQLRREHVSDALRDEFGFRRYKTKDPVPVALSWSPNSLFFKAWMTEMGCPVLERTAKTGDPSWAESVLRQLMPDYPVLSLVLEARKLGKDVGYLRSWLDKRDEDDRLHPTFKPAHVTTGRLSSANPNAQQISRHLKECIVSPEGWHFIQADYAQVELRIAALIAHEENMLAAFQRGDDLHRLMGARIAGVEPEAVTKSQRQAAKAVNFGFLYGMGAAKFVDHARDDYGVEFTLAEAQKLRGLFFEMWPRLGAWHEEQRRAAHTNGYVRSAIGRRRRLPDLMSDEGGKVAAAERQAINAPVQSLASDLMLTSLITLDRDPSPDLKVVGTVHDSLLAEVRAGHVREEVDRISRAMLYPPVKALFGVELTVPLEVEFLIGSSWGDAHPKVVVVKSQPSTST